MGEKKIFLFDFFFWKPLFKASLICNTFFKLKKETSFHKIFFFFLFYLYSSFTQLLFLVILFYDCRCYLGFAKKARTCSRNTGNTRRPTWQRRDFTRGNSRNSISRRWWVHQWVHLYIFSNNKLNLFSFGIYIILWKKKKNPRTNCNQKSILIKLKLKFVTKVFFQKKIYST